MLVIPQIQPIVDDLTKKGMRADIGKLELAMPPGKWAKLPYVFEKGHIVDSRTGKIVMVDGMVVPIVEVATAF